MPIRVTITSKELEQAARRLSKALIAPKPILRDLGQVAIDSVQGYFEGEQAPGGQRWKRLNPRYLAWKIKRGFSPRILRKRGRLLKSLKRPAYDSTSVSIGTDLPYARIHQLGGVLNRAGGRRTQRFKVGKSGKSRFARKGRGNFEQDFQVGPYQVKIPARPYLNLDDDPAFIKAAALRVYSRIDQIWSGGSSQ